MKYGSRTAVMQNVPLPPADQQMLTCAELCRVLNISPATARRLGSEAGAIVRIGQRNSRYDLLQVKAYLAQQSQAE